MLIGMYFKGGVSNEKQKFKINTKTCQYPNMDLKAL